MKSLAITVSAVIVLLIVFFTATVTVDQGKQAVITQFGRVVAEHTEPGLKFKIPFIQQVTMLEKKILEYSSAPTEVVTKDKKTLRVDNYTRWRIVQPVTFIQTMVTESAAQSRLDDLIYSELRVELGRYDMLEIIASDRDAIMAAVVKRVGAAARLFGIEVLDVRIKRTDLPADVLTSVFNRMKAERQRQAATYRSEGAEESLKIKADTDRQRAILLADAYREAQKIRGEGDAEAIRIYNQALNQDPEFYSFTRTLETYRKSLGSGTKLILTPDSDLLRLFQPGALNSVAPKAP